MIYSFSLKHIAYLLLPSLNEICILVQLTDIVIEPE